MNDDILFKICLTTALIGIIAIFVISKVTDLKTVTPSQINSTQDNMDFILYGKVENVRENDKAATFNIGEVHIESVDAVYFKRKNESTGIKKGDEVKLHALKYNGKIIVSGIQ